MIKRENCQRLYFYLLLHFALYFGIWLSTTRWGSTSGYSCSTAKFCFCGFIAFDFTVSWIGHFFVGRSHGFHTSLPIFVPFPLALGTLGAIIKLKSLPKSRTALLEMGAAGPICGFFCCIDLYCDWIAVEHK